MKSLFNLFKIWIIPAFLLAPIFILGCDDIDRKQHDGSISQQATERINIVESQQQFINMLFLMARNRREKSQMADLSDAEKHSIASYVNQFNSEESLYYLASECLDLRDQVSAAPINDSYVFVFQVAFWQCCKRLATFSTSESKAALTIIKPKLNLQDKHELEAILEKTTVTPYGDQRTEHQKF